ncbi:MAG: peptidoglycan editing factor PgeF [Clostridia bacterium]|nr:peptidoglycan editing factor PgeF [Clostridia bacterium]
MSFTLVSAQNGVKYMRSDIIPVRHGFATRVGGVSHEPHTASLNLAFRRGDDEQTVIENLRLFSEAVGVCAESVVSRHQIHSSRVVYADEKMCGEGYFRECDEGCDGYVTDRVGVTLGVKTADCVPILFCDHDAHIIGAVHAGWRGTASGIAAECVSKMCELGANVKNIRAAVGAAIHSCCYEVGEDFRESVTALAGEKMAREFIHERDGGLYADIIGMNRSMLLGAGVHDENIDISEKCTCCEPSLFYSHRYSHGVRGTMLSVISL